MRAHIHIQLHTPFLHKAEEVIQKLFPLWVSIQFIQLWGGRNKRSPLVFCITHPYMFKTITTSNTSQYRLRQSDGKLGNSLHV